MELMEQARSLFDAATAIEGRAKADIEKYNDRVSKLKSAIAEREAMIKKYQSDIEKYNLEMSSMATDAPNKAMISEVQQAVKIKEALGPLFG